MRTQLRPGTAKVARAHSVWDSASLERQALGYKREADLQTVQDSVDRHKAMGAVLDDPDLTAPDQAWIGQSLSPAEFERRLRRISTKFFFMTNEDLARVFPTFKAPANPRGKFKSVMVLTPDNKLQATGICYQDLPMIPEYSIMDKVTQDIPDATTKHVDRKDLPRHEFNETTQCWDVDTSKPRPGFIRITMAYTEKYRGWRTVLLKLWQNGWLELSDVVREFGMADRLGWAAHTGAHQVVSPY